MPRGEANSSIPELECFLCGDETGLPQHIVTKRGGSYVRFCDPCWASHGPIFSDDGLDDEEA